MAYLKTLNIHTGIHYPILIPDQPVMVSKQCVIEGSLSIAQRLTKTELSLPIHPYLTDEEIKAVINACNAWILG